MKKMKMKKLITKIVGSLITLPLMVFAEGGIGVGNLKNKAEEIPDSKMMISYNESWKSEIKANKLTLESRYGSTIEAKLTKGADLNIPTGKSLQSFMAEQQPQHSWKLVDIEGLKGVRGDKLSSEKEKSTIVYLASDNGDFIQITAYLKNISNDQKEGEEILNSVRIKYLGKPMINSPVKTVTLNQYGSFADDYFPPEPHTTVRSVAIYFPRSNNTELRIGAAGADWGRIVDLGPNSDVPFEKIQVNGEYLEAPQGAILLADIYTVFNPKNLKNNQNSLELKEGHVYLIRTVSWPYEDMVTKMRVDSISDGKKVITYQKLAYVEPQVLQRQVDQLIEYTKKYEQPKSSGTVTLYERYKWDSYPYASFSFEYSSSGNVHVTSNGWDLRFEAYNNEPYLIASRTSGEVSALISMNDKNFNEIQKKDFPKSLRGYPQRIVMQKNAIYGVYHKVYTEENNVGTIYGVVKILDMAPDYSWVTLKFRRIALEPATPMLEWEDIPVDSIVQRRDVDHTRDQCYFRNCALEPNSPIEFYFTTFKDSFNKNPEIDIDSRPFGAKRGFLKLDRRKRLEDYSLAELESIEGQFFHRIKNYTEGDVFLVNFEDYEQKFIMIFKVEKIYSTKKIEFSIRKFKQLKALK